MTPKLFATLGFVETSLAEELRPLLIPLAYHERFVDADYLEAMASELGEAWKRAPIDRMLAALGVAGLVRDRGQAIHELHPALSGYLRSRLKGVPSAERDKWARVFVDFMGTLADSLTPKPLHEQRFGFHVHGANFHAALAAAERVDMPQDFAALTQALAAYALNTRNFPAAEVLYRRLAEHCRQQGNKKGEPSAYHQLGRVAEGRRDFAAAEGWYKKSLEIEERLGNEPGAALTYHQLGRVAEERRDLAAAESWYQKSLRINECIGNEPGAALTYHQLGIVAHEHRDFAAAEAWYKKALEIRERLGIEDWAATDYHQLGRVAQERRDFAAAEDWYKKALEIDERLGNDHDAASTYHNLGTVAQARRDFAVAEGWYKKSLEINERLGDEHGSALTCGQLGILAGLGERHEETASLLIRCVCTLARLSDPAGVERNTKNFLVFFRRAPEEARARMKAIWEEAGLGPLPSE